MTSDSTNPPTAAPTSPAEGRVRPSSDDRDDRIARALRGFGPLGLLAMLVIVVAFNPAIKSLLVLAWAWRSRTPWRDIGYVRPRSWLRTLMVGLVLGAAFKLLMKAIVMPLLGAPPTNSAYHFLVGNTAVLPAMVLAVIVGAGFGEETFFRGYLFERLGKLFGSSVSAKTSIVVLTSVVFALVHIPEQGLAGAEQALVTGLAFGSIFAVTGRLFPLMIAHAAFDLTAVAIIYWNLEAVVAHLVFR